MENKSYYTYKGGVYYQKAETKVGETQYDLSHFNFRKAGLGYLKSNKGKLTQVILDFSYFNKEFGVKIAEFPFGVPETISGIRFSYFRAELEYSQTFYNPFFLRNRVYFGFLTNLSFDRMNIDPKILTEFTKIESFVSVGAGFNIIYRALDFEDSHLLLSSKINLIDIGYSFLYQYNPGITPDKWRSSHFNYNILRRQIGIDLSYIF